MPRSGFNLLMNCLLPRLLNGALVIVQTPVVVPRADIRKPVLIEFQSIYYVNAIGTEVCCLMIPEPSADVSQIRLQYHPDTPN